MIEVGDVIDYGFYINIKVIDMDDLYYYLEDKAGNKRKSYKFLVDKWITRINKK